MSDQETLTGLIIRAQSGFFSVLSADADLPVTCQLRGRLKQGPRLGDIAAVGDSVLFTIQSDGSGAIDEILPRKSEIVRLDPRPQGEYRQVLLANPDQAVFVFSCANPDPRLRMLDRFLVIAEKQNVPAVVVANKVDLVGIDAARKIFGFYPALGYPVIYTSTKQNLGLDEFRDVLQGKLSALAGPSGVGKSSLMNAIQPGLGIAVGEISMAMNKGKHTTNFRQLHPLEFGGWVADAPGWKSLALWDTESVEIDAYFPELRDLVSECQFSDCSHVHEPGCAVLQAVASGQVRRERYDSFLRLRDGQE
ncbi:MAG: ribosome small subunit-dependent GTPase A [Chloroflexi bacterium HGW-Chloroflexi-6]|nr:MAG: ribosome small subunit-dependent GTPase A [Chloroflexi bacterium HGW-Chloroflexi-6]